MLGEKEVRRRAAPMSSAMEWNALLNSPNSIGSTRVLAIAHLNNEVAPGIHASTRSRRQHGCRAVFGNYRRPCEDIAGRQKRAIVDIRFAASTDDCFPAISAPERLLCK